MTHLIISEVLFLMEVRRVLRMPMGAQLLAGKYLVSSDTTY